MPLCTLAQALNHLIGCILDGKVDGHGFRSAPERRQCVAALDLHRQQLIEISLLKAAVRFGRSLTFAYLILVNGTMAPPRCPRSTTCRPSASAVRRRPQS